MHKHSSTIKYYIKYVIIYLNDFIGNKLYKLLCFFFVFFTYQKLSCFVFLNRFFNFFSYFYKHHYFN